MNTPRDLAALRQMTAELSEYLLSEVVLWPLGGSADYPKLSLGSYWLTRRRLSVSAEPALPALIAGLIINFTMNMTAFATPALLGGARARVASFLAYEVNLVELNWPLGSAMAVGLLAVSLLLIWLSQRAAAAGNRGVMAEGGAR